MKCAFAALAAWAALVSASSPGVDAALVLGDALPPKLSDFRFFSGDPRVTPYSLNTPLFSDYTDKDRFAFVPDGQQATYRADGVVEFPVGSALIKTFRSGATKLETRVLLHRAGGWVALPYVWNAEQTEAVLKRAGMRIETRIADRAISYAVPNVNQCKECHQHGDALVPIGPKARNIVVDRSAVTFAALPAGQRLARWDDAAAPIEARARAYLDVNCGHCHNPAGSASNSGLNLVAEETNSVARGIGKRPVAAGRGSGGHDFAIDPGHPERSILIHRLKSTEPGVAMPELGRATVHAEGAKLLEQWIASLRQ